MKSAAYLAGRIEKLEAQYQELLAEQQIAINNASLAIGETYQILQGRADTRCIVDAVLVAQKYDEAKGVQLYRFSYGDGFDAKFVIGSARIVVWPDSDPDDEGKGVRSVTKLAALLVKCQSQIDKARADYEDASKQEDLEIGGTYDISIGRGETRKVVPAILLGQGFKTLVKLGADGEPVTYQVPQLKFFYGEGFDAEIVVGSARLLARTAADEAAEAAADAVADAEPAAEEASAE